MQQFCKCRPIKPKMRFYFLSSLLLSVYVDMSLANAAPTTTLNPSKTTNLVCSSSFWKKLWGVPAPEFRLAVGMWSIHATSKDRNEKNDLFGFSYKGFFAGTLVNSYYERAYTVGIQRYWVMEPLTQSINYEVGYRLGLVTGYQGHNIVGIKSLKDAPAIPFGQLLFALNWKFIGWEISTPDPYVISTGFYIRF